MIGALAELEFEISLCSWLPWTLTENGTEWSLVPKSDLLALLSGIRKLPDVCAGTLTDEHRARPSNPGTVDCCMPTAVPSVENASTMLSPRR